MNDKEKEFLIKSLLHFELLQRLKNMKSVLKTFKINSSVTKVLIKVYNTLNLTS